MTTNPLTATAEEGGEEIVEIITINPSTSNNIDALVVAKQSTDVKDEEAGATTASTEDNLSSYAEQVFADEPKLSTMPEDQKIAMQQYNYETPYGNCINKSSHIERH